MIIYTKRDGTILRTIDFSNKAFLKIHHLLYVEI